MTDIVDTLRELDCWYNELPGGSTRPTLLSKLAILELCGWLEVRFDLLVHAASSRVGLTREWVENEVVSRTYGFQYSDHLRKMLCRLVGESAVLYVELTFEADHPGKLEQMKAVLGMLWRSRGLLAHTHFAAPVVQQTTINAPSWTIDQQRMLAKSIDLYEASLLKAFSRTISAS
jgi:hypothetical protein